MKVVVEIGLKPGVLDPEAATIERALAHLGFEGITGLCKTRSFTFDLATADRDEARRHVDKMCGQLLANPVIESYRFEIGA